MWTWVIGTGRMVSPIGKTLTTGYAGAPGAINDPTQVDRVNIGPLPPGLYYIGAPVEVPRNPYFVPLDPSPLNAMHGRSGFGMHSDAPARPGTASEGCIVLTSDARHTIVSSGDRWLQVVPTEAALLTSAG